MISGFRYNIHKVLGWVSDISFSGIDMLLKFAKIQGCQLNKLSPHASEQLLVG